MQRRDALKTGFSLLAFALGGGAVCYERAVATSHPKLRPPGAVEGFEQHCIRCGLCVEACPFDTLRLAGWRDAGIANGTPFFVAREIPCYMCTDIPCLVACPTDALNSNLVSTEGKLDIFKAKMGIAVVDQENCLAYNGLQCDACYRACPSIDKALRLDVQRNERTGKHARLLPVVDGAHCTGCGKCERACVTQKATITVIERERVVGSIGDHYVRGWMENDETRLQKRELPTIKNDKLIDRLNQGVDYD